MPSPIPLNNSSGLAGLGRDEYALASAVLEALHTQLVRVPHLRVSPAQSDDYRRASASLRDFAFDGLLLVESAGETWEIWIELKLQAPPSVVRDVAKRLRGELRNKATRSYPVLAAPWLSPQSRAICEEVGIGYVDLAGNCRLSFGTVYIERTGFSAPKAEKRELKSLFGPKSARLLRAFLTEPRQSLKITDMVRLTDVSLGQASNVRKALLAQNWAVETQGGGIQLVEPRKLLDAWATVYKPPKHRRYSLYTLLHGGSLEEALRRAMSQSASPASQVKLALASHSAAQYWAPYLRNPSTHLYALDLEPVLPNLQAKPVDRGGNLIVDVLEDSGYFLDVREIKDGLRVTSPVQTYLDLQYAGERNREAAQHLLSSVILRQWSAE